MAARKRAAADASAEPRRYRVTYRHGLNLRAGAGLEHPVLAVLPCGAEVKTSGPSEGGWLPVSSGAGGGWVLAEHLAPAEV